MNDVVELRLVRPAPAIDPDTVLVVTEALLPLVAWRDVPVVRVVREELTRLERFMLEAALALGGVDAATFDELVSLPRGVLAGGMSRLVAGGAVELVAGEFRVVAEVAARFLAQEAVVRELPSTMDFALLPRTGDLLAVDPKAGTTWPRELERAKLKPAAMAPVPRELWDQRRDAYLASRVGGGIRGARGEELRIRGSGDDVPLLSTGIGASAKHEGVCSAYRCSAVVRRVPGRGLVVDARLHGRTKPGRRSDEASDEDGTGAVRVDLSGATSLVESWRELADALEYPAWRRLAWSYIAPGATSSTAGVMASQTPVARRKGPSEWELALNGQAAQAIAGEGRALTEPVGLAVGGEEAIVALACGFAPADEQARALFARDGVAASLLSSDAPADELARACHDARAPISPESVRERIWQLKWYRLAYALREREDFIHD